jgi:SAM-dependent methyltransferase
VKGLVDTSSLEARYRAREAQPWWRRAIEPPAPFVMNRREPRDFPLGRWNLYIGGAGRHVAGYVNLDIACVAGVDVAADAHVLPFRDALFQRVECDAVLEHVRDPTRVMREIRRVLAPGGYAHLVTPFCHPFHEYPKDYRRFTVDGLRELAGDLEVVAAGWRTGPAATMLVFTLEFAKALLPWRWWRGTAHVGLGWVLFPLRYLDLWLLRTEAAGRLGNHCYLWVRKGDANREGE